MTTPPAAQDRNEPSATRLVLAVAAMLSRAATLVAAVHADS
jgi:hypothetical protein